MTTYAKRELTYIAIPNTTDNVDLLASLNATLDPNYFGPEIVIAWCVELNSLDQICANQTEFDLRYTEIVS